MNALSVHWEQFEKRLNGVKNSVERGQEKAKSIELIVRSKQQLEETVISVQVRRQK